MLHKFTDDGLLPDYHIIRIPRGTLIEYSLFSRGRYISEYVGRSDTHAISHFFPDYKPSYKFI